jgi:hypothetical protein
LLIVNGQDFFEHTGDLCADLTHAITLRPAGSLIQCSLRTSVQIDRYITESGFL